MKWLFNFFLHICIPQINALATISGLLLPALRARCHSLFEVGPVFVHGQNWQKLIEVSADGFIDCLEGENCNLKEITTKHGKVIVEAKCRFPDDKFLTQPFYVIPKRYVPQTLAEMAAHNADELWLITYTEKSLTLCIIKFDADLWAKMLSLAEELFGKANVAVPTKLHALSKVLREEVKAFINTKCTFVCEVPSFRGEEGNLIPGEHVSPYAPQEPSIFRAPKFSDITKNSKVLASEARQIFKEVWQLLRNMATEVGVFMLSDKDRIYDEYKPNSFPVAYLMKNSSLSTDLLRSIVNDVRNTLKREEVNILCEIYDGQWGNLVFNNSEGFPLTLLGLARKSFAHISRLKKEKCINEMCEAVRVRARDKDLLRFRKMLPGHTYQLNNISACKTNTGKIILQSKGGDKFPQPVLQDFKFDGSNRCWNEHDPQKEQALLDQRHECATRKQIGLLPEEKNLLAALSANVVNDIEEEVDENLDAEAEEILLRDLIPGASRLQKKLTDSNFNLLSDIREELASFDHRKWSDLTIDTLFPTLLQNPQNLFDNMRKKDLKVVARVLEGYTGRPWYRDSFNKMEIVNMISRAFDAENFLQPRTVEDVRKFNPNTLHFLCKKVLMSTNYSTLSLQSSYAKVVHKFNKQKWLKNCRKKLTVTLPNGETMRLFSYPEYSNVRKQNEFRTLDYSHILNNMRSHIVRKGYEFCGNDGFKKLADKSPHILSRAIVYDNIDTQNVFTSIRFFGEPVENFLRKNNFIDSADFVHVVRDWHNACNMRGIPADTRVMHLYKMHKFLTQGIDFDTYPFEHIGKYIRGMPTTTWEALLQNISTRIALFEEAAQQCYNQRAVSTLANESFFSDMCRLDRTGGRYMKSTSVGKIISKAVLINHYKHKPNKSYALCTSTRGTYPVHLSINSLECLILQDDGVQRSCFKNHFFDFPDEHKSHRCRRDDITTGMECLRCMDGVRQHHRTDESKILAETRAGLPVKPFPKSKGNN